MDTNLREKIAKIYELVKRGATEGERQAAKNRLDKILSKHNLEGIDLDSIDKTIYSFKYSTEMELWLIPALVRYFLDDAAAIKAATRSTYKVRQVNLHLTYANYILIEAAYEYFRRHMKSQWKIHCTGKLQKCRKNKTRNKRRKELQDIFFNRYIIASNLYKEEQLVDMDMTGLSEADLEELIAMRNVEGGQYHSQVSNGLVLDEHPSSTTQLDLFK